jgi:hypothetical protein
MCKNIIVVNASKIEELIRGVPFRDASRRKLDDVTRASGRGQTQRVHFPASKLRNRPAGGSVVIQGDKLRHFIYWISGRFELHRALKGTTAWASCSLR